jgi:hypothetical protein
MSLRIHVSASLILATVILGSCMKDVVKEKYTFYRPVYKTRAQVRAEARSSEPVAIDEPGKIFIKGNHVFLNEIDKGIHIIDISNPSSPRNVAFVKIPGAVDMAVRGDILYADCYTDLVAMDIRDPRNAVVKTFLEGVFPHRVYTNGFMADTNLVITEWKRVDTVVTGSPGEADIMPWRGGVLFGSPRAMAQSGAASSGAVNGTGGSMARFGLMDDRLYTVSFDDLKVFRTTDPAKPAFVKSVDLRQGDIETIFPYRDRLFIGSQTGMFIYDASNRDNPTRLGQFTHARACDPVIADDTHAFVTLRSNEMCPGNLNQLDVVDIRDLNAPKLSKTYPMTGPSGLSKDGHLLFICDGKSGLRIMDASKPDAIQSVRTIDIAEPYDVIAWNGIAIVTAKEGLFLVDYTNPSNAGIRSRINVID